MNNVISRCRSRNAHQKKTTSAGTRSSSSQRICRCAKFIEELPIADCRLPIGSVVSPHEPRRTQSQNENLCLANYQIEPRDSQEGRRRTRDCQTDLAEWNIGRGQLSRELSSAKPGGIH